MQNFRKLTALAIIELEIEAKFAGKLWCYVPIISNENAPGFVTLGIAIANQPGYCPVPHFWCHVPEGKGALEAMSAHSSELNRARGITKELEVRIEASTLARHRPDMDLEKIDLASLRTGTAEIASVDAIARRLDA